MLIELVLSWRLPWPPVGTLSSQEVQEAIVRHWIESMEIIWYWLRSTDCPHSPRQCLSSFSTCWPWGGKSLEVLISVRFVAWVSLDFDIIETWIQTLSRPFTYRETSACSYIRLRCTHQNRLHELSHVSNTHARWLACGKCSLIIITDKIIERA